MTRLAVLSGGEGVRMGKPKDLLVAGGQPVLCALLTRLNWSGSTLLVAPHGGRLPPGHEFFEEVVSDAVPGQGPLRGILTALLSGTGEDEVVVIPVDMPGLETRHLAWIANELAQRPAALGVMLKRADRIEPFPCAFRVAASGLIQRRLEAGEFGVRLLAAEPGIEVVEASETWRPSVWKNVNEPADLPPGWEKGRA